MKFIYSALLAAMIARVAAGADETARKPLPHGTLDLQSVEGLAVRVALKTDKLTVVTPYGTLQIPMGEIQRIEFATRVSGEDEQRIAAAIAGLGNSRFRAREAASAVLRRMGEKAYLALQEAEKSPDQEVRRRAVQLLERVQQQLGDDLIPIRAVDVVFTRNSKIAGRLAVSELEGRSAKGAVRLRVADLRSLTLPDADGIDISKAIPDPGTLTGYENQIGKTFVFKVTGNTSGGFVWGTDVYTSDSTLAMAVVHAGLLTAGKTGYVRVRIVTPPASYSGSTRHGITSADYGPWQGAYRVSK